MSDVFKSKVQETIKTFRTAYYGEDVREAYADIAEIVCLESMDKLDESINHATSQGNYALAQGNYAKEQGDYAREVLSANMYVYSPVDGIKKTVQEALYDMRREYTSNYQKCLTAFAFDSLELTAKQYDDLNITAYNYDLYSEIYLS